MLFVNNDEAKVRQRGKDRRARADNNSAFAACRKTPGILPLPCRHSAVNDDDLIAKMRCEPPDHLRREGDLGNKDDRRLPGRQTVPDRFDVDLGLPASRDAVQQERSPLVCILRCGQRTQHVLLAGVQDNGQRLQFRSEFLPPGYFLP